MARRPVTRPTTIYWLLDVRPETLAARGIGMPFYCGKTIYSIHKRLAEHRAAALRRPDRPVALWLQTCGEHVEIQMTEIVPPTADWAARERHWIQTLRLIFPGCANSTDGGEGIAGYIYTPEQCAHLSRLRKGKIKSREHCANLSRAMVGLKRPIETRLKMSRTRKGVPKTLEHRAKIAAGLRRASAEKTRYVPKVKQRKIVLKVKKRKPVLKVKPLTKRQLADRRRRAVEERRIAALPLPPY